MFSSAITRYGKTLNSHDLIKIVGLLLMVIDHVGQYLWEDNLWCRLLGRGAAPLFFFLIGYVNHLNIRPTLILYGLILSLTGCLIWDHLWINILINFMFCQLILWMVPVESLSMRTKILFFVLLSVLNGFAIPYLEYGLVGILWIYSARLCALKSSDAPYWISATALCYFLWENILFGFYQHTEMIVVFSILIILLAVSMITYRFTTFACTALLRIPGLLLSRYSLAFYFYHLILLQGYYFMHRLPL